MLKGVYLTLLIGPAVPVPAPQAVTDAVTSVQVTSGIDKSGFQITFGVSKTSPLLSRAWMRISGPCWTPRSVIWNVGSKASSRRT